MVVVALAQMEGEEKILACEVNKLVEQKEEEMEVGE